MEIPIRVVSNDLSDIKTKGDGWELITEEKGNPSLAKLKDLLSTPKKRKYFASKCINGSPPNQLIDNSRSARNCSLMN